MGTIKEIKTNSASWEMALKAVQSDVLTKKIVAEQFNDGTDAERKTVLGVAFRMAMEKANGGAVYYNMNCFNADHADKTPSMVFDQSRGHFHCYGCMDAGENFDVFDVIKFAYPECKGFRACYEKAVELFVDRPEAVVYTYQAKGDMFPKAMYKTLKNPYYTPIQNDPDGLEYLSSRGITKETAVKHGVMTWEHQGWLYLVFVNDNGTVVRRRFAKTDVADMYSDMPSKWWNQSGAGGYFNLRAIDKAKEEGQVVFVTESAIDALSVAECKYPAVGLNSVNRFAGLLSQTDYPYLVGLFDNDEMGRNKAAVMEQHGFFTVNYDPELYLFLARYKDINEALTANKLRASTDLTMAEAQARIYYGLV